MSIENKAKVVAVLHTEYCLNDKSCKYCTLGKNIFFSKLVLQLQSFFFTPNQGLIFKVGHQVINVVIYYHYIFILRRWQTLYF